MKKKIDVLSIESKETNVKGEAKYITSITYGVTEEVYSLGGSIRKAYGIAAYSNALCDRTATVLVSVNDISSERDKLEELVQICNRSELSLIHLHDVIEDFMAN